MRTIVQLFSLEGVVFGLSLNLANTQASNNPGFGLGSKGRMHAFFSENGGMIRDQDKQGS